ncbi:hypothetical protein MtrunA17_Chr5g0410891 [Medicago truncatula]|uniref:Uncharacterized protein n=1 Tax=Medicago truncatula TaxID=3880 RepID=A0A396HNB6_MEDTR|nr:hypothetical protein MtrunA17_Chr5g0410891 [Medicago truncatula]
MRLLSLLLSMTMGRFSSTNTLKQLLLTPQKALICKFPTVWVDLPETLIQLSHEA